MNWREHQELAKRAAFEAEKLRLFAKIPHIAPLDPIEVARMRGCEIRFMSLPSLEGMYSPVPKPLIVLGSERRPGRRTFTCAHELAHHIFKHGVMLEQLNEQKLECSEKTPEEFIADSFAGHLLMSKSVVGSAFKTRGINASNLTPEQAYSLACYFGVGYGTVINHITHVLKLISKRHSEILLKFQPREIKAQYDTKPNNELILADFHWQYRTLDVEVGDTVVLPAIASIEPGNKLRLVATKNDFSIYKAISSGYSRTYRYEIDWAIHIRISPKNYEGLAQYRYLEDMEDL